ncbi:MAG: hypothetical protein QOE63_1964, partial [Acidimicrobiaceae bacterium]
MEADLHPAPHGESGYTIIEIMVAMLILLVGVFGTLVMLEGSFAGTRQTATRDQGTNLARDLAERTRQSPYASIGSASVLAAAAASLPEAPSVSGTTFQVTRRDTLYTVSVSSCTVDDPSDGVGVGNATFCQNQTGSGGGGSSTTVGGSINVLGLTVPLITVGATGSLLATVCNAVGTNTTILTQVTAAVSTLIPVSACTASNPTGSTVPYDSNPDDLRRVRVDVSWTKGHGGAVSQTTLVPNP